MSANAHQQSHNFMAVCRVTCGATLAIGCGIWFAQNHNVMPALASWRYIAAFPILGVVWGLLITWPIRPIGGSVAKAKPRLTAVKIDIVNAKLRRAGQGALYFSALGAIAHSVEMYSNLDQRDAILPHLSHVTGTLFLGLIIAASFFAITSALTFSQSIKKKGRDIKEPAVLDVNWYLLSSVCIVGCSCLVFYILTV